MATRDISPERTWQESSSERTVEKLREKLESLQNDLDGLTGPEGAGGSGAGKKFILQQGKKKPL